MRTIGPPAASAALGLVASILIARVFGAEGRGLYAIGITWMMTIGQVLSMGLGDALAVSLRRYLAPDRPRAFIVACWAVMAAVAAALALFGAASPMIAAGSVTAGIMLQATSFTLAAGSRLKWAAALLAQPIAVVLTSVVAVGLDLGIEAVLIAYVCAPMVAGALFLSDLRPPAECEAPHPRPYLRVLRIGAQRQLTVTLAFLVRSVDILALGFFFDPKIAGIYAVARSLVNLCLLAPQAMSGFVLRAELSGRGTSKTKVLGAMSGWSLLGVLPVLALGWFLIPAVWGGDFAPAYGVFVILAVGCVATGSTRGVLAWRNARDLQATVSRRYVLLSAPLAVLIAAAAGLGDMHGAAVGSTLAAAVLLLAAWLPVRGEGHSSSPAVTT